MGAGLIDASTGSRIVEFETAREQGVSLRWPVVLALVFGALLLAAGIALFVAAVIFDVIDVAGTVQPAPAPRFSRTAPEVSRPPAHPGQHTREVLLEWGLAEDAVDGLFASGAAK